MGSPMGARPVVDRLKVGPAILAATKAGATACQPGSGVRGHRRNCPCHQHHELIVSGRLGGSQPVRGACVSEPFRSGRGRDPSPDAARGVASRLPAGAEPAAAHAARRRGRASTEAASTGPARLPLAPAGGGRRTGRCGGGRVIAERQRGRRRDTLSGTQQTCIGRIERSSRGPCCRKCRRPQLSRSARSRSRANDTPGRDHRRRAPPKRPLEGAARSVRAHATFGRRSHPGGGH